MNSKALIGLGVAAAAGVGLVLMSDDAKADPGKKELPGGGTKGDLALATTVALTTQNIPDVRAAIKAWNDASDPLTAGALSFTLDGALAGQNLAQWLPDGENGSPLLRAFGLRVFQLEGRPALLKIWAKAWKTVLPKLSAELSKKAGDIKPKSEDGTADDPVPPAELVERIEEAVASGDTDLMRKLADELEALGFDDAAKDLRTAAKAIDDQKVEPPAPPAPTDDDIPPGPAPGPSPKPKDPKKPKEPAAPALPTGAGRIYVVLSGDNPSKIARKITGDPNRFRELVRENSPPKKKSADGGFATLSAGERLKVPASWPAHPEAVRGTAAVREPASPGKPATPAPAPVAPSGGSGRLYTVLPNDSPSKIAAKITGNGNRWPELVKENVPPKKKASNGNFTTLSAGERLKVPASWPAHPEAVSGGGTAIVPAPANPTVPAPGGPRFYVVQPGDNPSKIARTITGDPNRFRELVGANVPPKKKSADGGFTTLFPGEKLKMPASWPTGPNVVFSGDFAQAHSPRDMAQSRAGLIGLNAHLGKSNPSLLAEFQRDHGLEATGEYGPATALCLAVKYGMVPPAPHVWGTKPQALRQKFADCMFQLAKKDPQRRDEFRRVAFQALGKVA